MRHLRRSLPVPALSPIVLYIQSAILFSRQDIIYSSTLQMISTRVNTKLCSPKQVAQLTRAVAPIYQTKSSIVGYPAGVRIACAAYQPQHSSTPRSFSTTSVSRLRDFFPPKETAYIRQTPPAWPHHGYTEAEMLAVVPDHREPKTLGEKCAWKLIRVCRYVVAPSS